MPQAEPYTPDALLAELHADLEPWLRANKGTLSVAADPYNFLELLADSPSAFRVVLHWAGEQNPSDQEGAGVFAPQKFDLGVTANLGLTATPEIALFKPGPNATRPPLLQLVAAVRDRVRGYTWPAGNTTRYMLYRGCDPVTLPDAMPLRAYRLQFQLTIGLPPAYYRNLL
ncbi:hypothetical protein [Geminisphaera colitermitum]|uniref:hypothetical protein n=1 Tax=Geminisphaera colitermitum TaxID=1148786 RepID=UPI000158CBAC|nr:hypothetical protein [Geminisphaera colitermitum]